MDDPLTDVLRHGATRLLAAAIDAEVEAHLATYRDLKLPDGRQRLVRHGTLPEREMQTGIGPVPVRMPRVREACHWDAEARLCLAGEWCIGPNVEDAYLSGTLLAERVLQVT